jgi:segregation and condensation protein A
VSVQVIHHQLDGVQIETPVYSGPLDLLLELIEKAQLDITKVALAQVTNQYLSTIQDLEARHPEEISAFLVIAARLLQIKSEALLPRPVVREMGEVDPGDALVQQLILYKRFKRIGEWMVAREKEGYHTDVRRAAPAVLEGKLDMSGITISDLVFAAQSVFHRSARQPTLDEVVTIPILTIRQKIQHIMENVRNRDQVTFFDLIGSSASRVEVIVAFLAVLELVKRHILVAHQETKFANIEFQITDQWDTNVEFEAESIDSE